MTVKNQVRPKVSYIVKITLIYSLVLFALIFGIFSSRLARAFPQNYLKSELIIQDVICFILWLVIVIISLYILLKQNYYVLTNSSLTHHKWTKDIEYRYADILYFDDIYSSKHSSLLFYLNNGRAIFLVKDKDDKLINAIKSNSKNLISRDEFHQKFPKISL